MPSTRTGVEIPRNPGQFRPRLSLERACKYGRHRCASRTKFSVLGRSRYAPSRKLSGMIFSESWICRLSRRTITSALTAVAILKGIREELFRHFNTALTRLFYRVLSYLSKSFFDIRVCFVKDSFFQRICRNVRGSVARFSFFPCIAPGSIGIRDFDTIQALGESSR